MTNVLADKAVLAVLSISVWTARKFDKKITNETNERFAAGNDAGRYNKQLIAKARIQQIQQVAGEARQLHYHLTQPWLDEGARVLPSTLYLDYANKLRDLRRQFKDEADAFSREYPAMIEEARKRLNGMFNENDYPIPAHIRSKFAFDLKIMPCPDSGDFRVDIPNEHLREIEDDLENHLQDALNNAMKDSCNRIVTVVGYMAERLKAYDPKKSREEQNYFKDTLVPNVRDLAELLPAFNLSGDPKMTKIIDRIQKELCTEETKVLRKDEDVREAVQKSAEDILAQVEAFMT